MNEKSTEPNVNVYWEHVKRMYPNAVFNYWCPCGKLEFYCDRKAEKADKFGRYVSSCIQKDGKFVTYHHGHIDLSSKNCTF